jgi:hypothetical protein
MSGSSNTKQYWLAHLLVGCCLALCCSLNTQAQSKAAQKGAQRYEIDAKRMGVDPGSEDALPRSREFLRIDSTYYVGWFYEGFYKLNHAADYLGYKNAIIPLERALNVLERDYPKQLSTRTNDVQVYFPVYNYQLDYSRIGYALRECYANTDQPEKVVALMRRALKWKFQRDLYLDPYNYLAWTTHRYRFYTDRQYSFLKGSIDENEKLAMRYLDSSLRNIALNRKYNQGLYQPGYETADRLGVYHYKCILYSYAFNIDSAEKYYDLMRASNALPHNNYANFKAVCGNFREAEKEYEIASGQDNGDKRLQEWAYYTSIIDISKGKSHKAISLCRAMIQGYGSTPGFGWYNIALARALAYDGQLDESEKAAEKAANFKEVHIGTTLGQSHYDFSIQLLRLIQKEQRIAMQKFEHKDWWYSPRQLGNMAQMATERLMQQYLIVNQFAQNPERDRVVYKLFSTESTVSWDEVWYLIKDFSTAFFVKRFEQELKENKRKPVNKYFKLFLARLKTKQGKYKEAKTLLNEMIQDPTTDAEYEQLLIARCFQSFAELAEKENNKADQAKWTYQLFKTYPQLIPFCGLQAPLKIKVSGNDPAVMKAFSNCNFNTGADVAQSMKASISFTKKGDKNLITYSVADAAGRTVVPAQHFTYKSGEKAGIELAYRICGVGIKDPEDDTKK